MSLSSAQIPWTWYSFSEYLGTNLLEVDSSVGSLNLVVPDGNYNIYELVDLIHADSNFPYECTYNANTSKITLTNTVADNTTHIINFGNTTSQGLAKALGFERVDESIAGSASTISDETVNLQIVHSIFLHSSLSVGNVITTTHGNYESILDKIPIVASGPFGIINYSPYLSAPFMALLHQNEINHFSLQLRDQNGKLLQLNGAHYELTLLVEIVKMKVHVQGSEHTQLGLHREVNKHSTHYESDLHEFGNKRSRLEDDRDPNGKNDGLVKTHDDHIVSDEPVIEEEQVNEDLDNAVMMAVQLTL
ncbi:MAG: hypothetical protein JKY09_08160 [Crocinitomicaceae bacterium]|nr:hypothetical protein [Crocinitomicaceae bacterium]